MLLLENLTKIWRLDFISAISQSFRCLVAVSPSMTTDFWFTDLLELFSIVPWLLFFSVEFVFIVQRILGEISISLISLYFAELMNSYKITLKLMNSVQVAFAFNNKFNNKYIFLKFILHSAHWDLSSATFSKRKFNKN